MDSHLLISTVSIFTTSACYATSATWIHSLRKYAQLGLGTFSYQSDIWFYWEHETQQNFSGCVTNRFEWTRPWVHCCYLLKCWWLLFLHGLFMLPTFAFHTHMHIWISAFHAYMNVNAAFCSKDLRLFRHILFSCWIKCILMWYLSSLYLILTKLTSSAQLK